MSYRVIPENAVFKTGEYEVVPLRREDILDIMQWRNEQIDVLRQKRPLTESDQLNYWENTIVPSFSQQHPRIVLVSFLHNGTCIGYGGLTNMDWEDGRAEISFLVDTALTRDPAGYTAAFSAFLELMKQLGLRALGFNRLFTETYDRRPLHISILESSGFIEEGRMREHVKIDGNFVDSLIHGFLARDYVAE